MGGSPKGPSKPQLEEEWLPNPPAQAWRRASSHRRLWCLSGDCSNQQRPGGLSGAWGLGRHYRPHMSPVSRASQGLGHLCGWPRGIQKGEVLCCEGASLE